MKVILPPLHDIIFIEFVEELLHKQMGIPDLILVVTHGDCLFHYFYESRGFYFLFGLIADCIFGGYYKLVTCLEVSVSGIRKCCH